MRRQTYAVAALAMVAFSAGCGGTRSNGGSHAATPTTRAKSVRFAECMRANGVGGFPDPDASGALTIDAVANGPSPSSTRIASHRRQRRVVRAFSTRRCTRAATTHPRRACGGASDA
jgi:hypothetical protein